MSRHLRSALSYYRFVGLLCLTSSFTYGQIESCSSALGMGNGEIADSQITASSFDSTSSAPYKARINSSSSELWIPVCCGNKNFLKVDLLAPHKISKLYVQGSSSEYYVKSFNVLYSLDDLVWSAYSDTADGEIKEFQGNNGNNIVPIYFNRPFTAVKIVIVPRSWSYRLGLRLEIFGCKTNATIPRATEVTQNIQTSSVQWTRENSPYVVRQRLSVAAGSTLTIEAGVKVVFIGVDSGLDIEGCLQMNGLKGIEVQFLSNNPLSLIFNSDVAGNPFWQGIAINSVSSVCQVREISNAIIYGANIGITLTADNFRLSNIAFRCSQTGLALTRTGNGTEVSITSCAFEDNQYGMTAKLSGSTTILSTTYRRNRYAVTFEVDSSTTQMEQKKSLEIVESTFTDNDYGLFAASAYYYNNYLLLLRLSKNKFFRSNINVDNYIGHCGSALKTEIDECMFVKGQIYINVCYNYSLELNNSKLSETSTTLSGNCRSLSIFNNEFSEISGNSLTLSTYPSESKRIDSNTFVNNKGSSCISLTTQNRPDFPPGLISITGNKFKNNSVDNVVYIREDLSSKMQLNGNTFENPLSRYEIYQATPWNPGYLFDASRNWWGTSDLNVTLSRIYDFYTDFLSAEVEISSIYKEPEMLTTIDTSSSRDWTFDEISMGGRLRQNTSIDLDKVEGTSAIDVVSTIFVPRNTELKLIGSKILNFIGSTGILVEGVLLLNGGQGNNTIQLQPKIQSGQWGGILFINSKDSHLVNVDLRGSKNELRLRNSSLVIVNSRLELPNGISCDGSVPMTLEISDSEISSSSGISVQMNVNNAQVILSVTNTRIVSGYYYGGIAIFAYSSVVLTLENSSVLAPPDSFAVRVNSQTDNSNLTANINGSLVVGSISVATAYTNFSAFDSILRASGRSGYRDVVRISNYDNFPNSVNLTLRNNSISILEGGYNTLSLYNVYGPGASVRLHQNRFNGQTTYLLLFGPTVLDISGNIFNSSVEIQLKSLNSDGTPPTDNKAVQIKDNVFANISGDSAFLVGCKSNYEYTASIGVEGNTFMNNSVTSVLTSNCRGLYLTRNKFLTQQQTIAYRTSVPLSTGVVLYATGNFWNASNYGDVAAKIFDQQDDPSLSSVEISPWFNDINMTVFGKTESSFFRNGGREIGGTLSGDITLQKTNQSYIVVADIYVPFGLTLTIENGVQLDFKQGGITVEGRLVAIGSANNWIRMTSESNANSWRGINFQRKFVDEVYHHDSDWWEVYLQSQWWALEYLRNTDVIYMKRLSDIVCKQAGYKGAKEFGPYNCSVKTTSKDQTSSSTPRPGTERSSRSSLADKSPPCRNLSQRTQIYCNENNKILQDCNVYTYGYSENSLLRLECLPSVAAIDTHIVYKIVNTAGDEVISTSNDHLIINKDSVVNSLSNLFVAFRPCLAVSAATSDCVSFMSLAKPGWFLRHLGPTQLILEPKSNPSNSSTFLDDASFTIRRDQFISGSVAFESLNLPNYFVSVQNDSTRSLVLKNTGSFSNESASFRLIEQSPSVRRRKRQTSGTDGSEKSHLKFVRISYASVGITIDGESPLLENIVVENSTGSGIIQRGYTSGNFTITDSRIVFNGGTGISLTTNYYQIYSSQISIVGCEIIGNAGKGIEASSRSNITVTNCAIGNSGQSGIDIDVSQMSSLTAIVESSRIFGNGIGTAVNCNGRCILRNNSFVGNAVSCVSLGNGRSLVEGNVFEDNGIPGSPSSLYSANGWSMMFINNVVRRNRYLTAVTINSISEDVLITGNSFINNSRYSSPGLYGSVISLDYGNPKNVSVTGNYFDDPFAEFEIRINYYRGDNYDQRSVDLSFNFWNRQNYSGIIKRIDSFFDDMQKRPVNIWPAVLNPENNSILTIPDDNSHFFQDGTGGDVYTSLVIPFRNESYTIERSIYVDMEATLTIEAGVVLNFKSGRGLFVKGTLILVGSDELPVTFTGLQGTVWGGFVLMQPLFSNFTSGFVNLSHLVIAGSPYTVRISAPAITVDALKSASSITLLGGNIIIRNSVFNPSSTTNIGLTLSGSALFDPLARNATILNSVFNSSRYGISVEYQNALYMSGCNFTNNNYGILISDPANSGALVYTILNSQFQQNLRAVFISASRNCRIDFINNIIANDTIDTQSRESGLVISLGSVSDITIQNNTFANLSKGGVAISTYNNQYGISLITLKGNRFSNIFGTALTMNNILYSNSTIQNNTFALNSFPDGPAAVSISLWYTSPSYYTIGSISLFQNQFQQNVGQQIFKLTIPQYTSDNNYPFSKLSSNLFINNVATDSIILSQYHRLNVTQNIFKNPQTNVEMKVGFSNKFQENCTYNWWGSTDKREISSRLYDMSDDGALGQILFEPFLNASEFSCETVSGCSGHGFCILPETCECGDGWQGRDCSQASCSSVQNCFNRGRCVGPNRCECDVGWFGNDCSMATCTERRNCSDHGICVGPNQCLCSEQYSGIDCSQCSDGRWGPSCLPCPRCVHGTCEKVNGKCVCSGVNWAGDLCDTCAPKFFGAACLPIVRFSRIAPVSGPDIGGTNVHAIGANFPNVTSYRCRFGDMIVPGVWLSDEDILCLSPTRPAGQVVFSLSISPDQDFLSTQFSYTYYPHCPASACGSGASPPRGGCSMGSCVCFLPWIGADCSVLGLPPNIAPVPSQSLIESGALNLTVRLSQGTPPVEWRLLSSPNGMSIGALSGQLQWPKAIAKTDPYTVTVACRSDYGSDQMTFNLTVSPSYYAVLDSLPKGPFVRPQSVLISGRIYWKVNNTFLNGQQIPVNIIINNSGSRRTIASNTRSQTDQFYERFYPSQFDVGLFQADSRHPSDPGFSVQQSWSVYGLQIQVTNSNLVGYTGNISYAPFLNIINTGSDPMTGLQLLKVNVPFELRVWNSVLSPCVLSVTACPLSLVLRPGDSVVLNASIKVETAYSGYFSIVASTRETVSVSSAYVSFSFEEKLPSFRLSPGNVDATVSRGKTYFYQVNVTNVGLRSATDVKVILPKELIISVLSFGTNKNPTGSNLIMDSGDSAILILQVSPSVHENIGIRSGSVQVKSLETSSLIYYRLAIASVDRLNLTVSVEDEYTYFSADKPLLANATVSLTSKFGGETITRITNAYGQATFEDIREDYYTLYTSADRHRPDQRVIFASAGNASAVTVFIQRVAVTYSWVVTPVTFEDRYDIKLEADFTTYVPIPVVTLTPNRLDLEILERGLMPVINFVIRNYGLIAAKGFRFQLPAADAHPFIRFQMDRELIGDIPANSTIIVAVKVVVNETKRDDYFNQMSPTSRKRRSAATCLALTLKALYYYICDRERYDDLIVSADYGSAYAANCGGGGGVAGWGGGWGPGIAGGDNGPSSARTDISVTSPLTCNKTINCLKAAFSCITATITTLQCVAGIVALPETAVGGPVTVIYVGGKVVKKCYKAGKKIVKCYEQVISCKNTKRRRRRSPTKDDLYPAIADQFVYIAEYYRLGEIIYGDTNWIDGEDTDWLDDFVQPAMFDTSPGGHLITESEYRRIISAPLPINVTVDMAKTLLQRFNNTIYLWDQGLYNSTDNNTIDHSAFVASNNTLAFGHERAKEAGFSSIAARYLDTYDRLQKAEESSDDGVCAKVRIQILQRLVLTRSAFSARLEIENGETKQLSNIRVEIIITDFETQDASNDRFSIGLPELSGISDVDGTGSLPVNTKGSAQWLIAPYSRAAPTNDKRYRIGGTLYYTVNGENITVPLFPDTVTVKPDPRLHISYFLEKYVYADDPLTTDVVEPVVPFALGILITNEGYGVANNLQISSAQPEIIENEKGLLIKFAIIGTQLGNSSLSPSLTVNFGDISPKTTKTARWIMTSTLSGTFSNYSATFKNTNPLGDPQLSVLDSLKIFEMLHVVRVDFPKDDGIVDFLTINPNSLDQLPNRIYTSDNGTQPLNVSIGNITLLSIQNSDSVQVTAECVGCVGWIYFRSEYLLSQMTVYSIRRSDGRIILPNYNVWIGKIKKKTYLHIVDYMPTTASTFTYSIKLSQSNADPPKFSQDVYNVSVVEESDPGDVVVRVFVTNRDTNKTLAYSLRDDGAQQQQPFAIGATDGVVRSRVRLDRETQDQYSIVVLVTDGSTPPQTGTTVVLVSVEDINDNAPVFGDFPSDIGIEKGTPAGHVLCRISASDKDLGPNGTVRLNLSDASGLFELNVQNGTLVTRSTLTATGMYVLTVTAKDEGKPSKSTNISIEVHVVEKDLYAPVFSSDHYVFSVNETKSLGTFVGQLTASDADNPDEKFSFQILAAPAVCGLPFQIDNTGRITNILELRSSSDACRQYNFTVRVTDSGDPPSGPLSATVNVTVNIVDVNDNAPEFQRYEYNISVVENSPPEMILLQLKAFDLDVGMNGAIVNYSLTQIFPVATSVAFRLDVVDGGEAVLKTMRSLDREQQDRYTLQIVAEDGGQPFLSSKPVIVNVIVDDVNDNAPVFLNASAGVMISWSTPVNTVVFRIRATDADSSAILRYVQEGDDQYFQVQSASGDVMLVKSLQDARYVSTVEVRVHATDGLFNSTTSFLLTVNISGENRHPPTFESHVYEISVNETESVGNVLLNLVATDPDSIVLYYAITAGNTDNRFKVDVITGSLSLVGQLSRKSMSAYNLTVEVFDSLDAGNGTLSDRATVLITVLEINEYAPVFTNGPEVQVHLAEGRITSRFLQLKATDGDGDNVTYSVVDSGNARQMFQVDRDSGWLSQIYPLIRQVASRYMVQIAATDSGIPSRRSVIDVVVFVDEAVLAFDVAFVNLTLTASSLLQNKTVYQAKATKFTVDGNVTIVYSLDDVSRRFFTIDNETGIIDVLTDQRPIGIFTVTVSADELTSRTATLTLMISIDGDWNASALTTVSPTTAAHSDKSSTTRSRANKGVSMGRSASGLFLELILICAILIGI